MFPIGLFLHAHIHAYIHEHVTCRHTSYYSGFFMGNLRRDISLILSVNLFMRVAYYSLVELVKLLHTCNTEQTFFFRKIVKYLLHDLN